MDPIILLILQSVYFLLPAYFANMAPVVAKKLGLMKALDVPVDEGKRFIDSREILGKNKTYRGFVAGAIAGLIIAYVQMALYNIPNMPFFKYISIPNLNYSSHLIVISLGILMGVGAITGDALKSFFKRRMNIGPGKKFIPFDQIDFVVGAYIFIIPLIILYDIGFNWQIILCSIILSFLLHIIVNHISFYLGIRGEKW